jgi:hypothetical protein
MKQPILQASSGDPGETIRRDVNIGARLDLVRVSRPHEDEGRCRARCLPLTHRSAVLKPQSLSNNRIARGCKYILNQNASMKSRAERPTITDFRQDE